MFYPVLVLMPLAALRGSANGRHEAPALTGPLNARRNACVVLPLVLFLFPAPFDAQTLECVN